MQLFQNNAWSALSGAISDVATTINLAVGSGARFPNPGGGDYFLLTLADLTTGSETAWEVVKVTARASDALTVVRAQEGTAARAWANGTPVDMRLTAGSLEARVDEHEAAADPHPQYMTSAETDARIALLVDSAPATLDTLNELAAALGDDPNFATTVTNAIAGKQASDATLTALAAVVTAANKLIYATGADTFATADLTAAGRALLDDADAAAQRTTLGLGTAATGTVQTSISDVTAGRLRIVGGANGTADGTQIDANNAAVGSVCYSFYDEDVAAASNFPALGGGINYVRGYVLETEGLPTRTRQYCTELFGLGTVRGRTFVRVRQESTWYPWVELLKAGDYGIGGPLPQLAESAMNDADLPSGAYNVTVAALGVAPINTNGYMQYHDNASAGYAARTYVPVSTTRMFMQVKVAGTWGAWQEVGMLGVANTWTAKQTFNGFSVLGESGPAIKTKKLTGTTAATEGATAVVAHGLTRAKILSCIVQVDDGTNTIFANDTISAGRHFSATVNATNVSVANHATNSETILSKAFTAFITYEE